MDFYCGVCRYALDHIQTRAGGRFEHSAAWERTYKGEPHEPDPVPLAEMLDVNMLCDVCSDTEPTWAYMFVPVQIVTGDLVENLSAEWMLCDPCADAAESRSVEAMLRRAALAWTRFGREVPDLPTFLNPVYEQLLASAFTRVPRAEVGV